MAGEHEATDFQVALTECGFNRLLNAKMYVLDGTTPAEMRDQMAKRLKDSGFEKGKRNVIVVANKVAESGLTMYINATVDCCLSIDADENGFLRLRTSTVTECWQRRGRGGRLAHLRDKQLG